jgi:hypothetical protein
MSPSDVMALFEAAFTRRAGNAVTQGGRNLQPMRLGDTDGFRFEMSYALADDVDRELVVTGAVRHGKLYLITYSGTRLYYFARYRGEYDRIVQTTQFIGS